MLQQIKETKNIKMSYPPQPEEDCTVFYCANHSEQRHDLPTMPGDDDCCKHCTIFLD